jgi:hypothetical protein
VKLNTKVILTTAVVLGFVGGVLAGPFKTADATPVSFYVYVHPGGTSANGVTDHLNCGWHSVCESPYPWGTGLDWRNSHGQNVFYRSYSNNNGGFVYAARALIEGTGTICKSTWVFHYRHSGVNDSVVRYVHTGTNLSGQEFYVWSGFYPQWTSTVVGQTITEPASCKTDGPHLHQETYAGHNHWVNPTPEFPTGATCNTGCGFKNIFQLYQLGYYWQQ